MSGKVMPSVDAWLAEAKADPNAQGRNGGTPLYRASGANDAIFELLLIDYHANPNIPLRDGYTPLHRVAEVNNTKRVELLLKYGANPNVKNKWGETPSDMTSNQEVEQLLAAPKKLWMFDD